MKIGEFQAWLTSKVAVTLVGSLIAQIVALLAAFGLVVPDSVADPAKVEAVLQTIFQFLALALGTWALRARVASPVAPLTLTKTAAAVKNDAASPDKQGSQSGNVRLATLAGITLLSLAVLAALPGCAGTKSAFKAAETPEETAYVIMELYAANVAEASTLARSAGVPAAAVKSMQDADRVAVPAIVALRELRNVYAATKSDASREALQAAVDEAARKLADLVRAVKTARGFI